MIGKLYLIVFFWERQDIWFHFREKIKSSPKGKVFPKSACCFLASSSKLLCYQILSVVWAVLSSHVSLNIIDFFLPLYCILGVLKAGRTVDDVGLTSVVSGWWVSFKGSHFCIYFKVSMTGYFSWLNISMLGKFSEFWMRYSSVTIKTIKTVKS